MLSPASKQAMGEPFMSAKWCTAAVVLSELVRYVLDSCAPSRAHSKDALVHADGRQRYEASALL